jgi:hypothetical protein
MRLPLNIARGRNHSRPIIEPLVKVAVNSVAYTRPGATSSLVDSIRTYPIGVAILRSVSSWRLGTLPVHQGTAETWTDGKVTITVGRDVWREVAFDSEKVGKQRPA